MSERRLIKCEYCDGQGHYYADEKKELYNVVRYDGSKVDGMPRIRLEAESFARWLNETGIWKPYTVRKIISPRS